MAAKRAKTEKTAAELVGEGLDALSSDPSNFVDSAPVNVTVETAPEPEAEVEEESNPRTIRASEERVDQEREMVWKPSRLLPTPNPVDGIDFRYVRVSSAGSIDNMNHSAALREGWEPVKAEEVMELGVVLSDRGHEEGNVVFGGMMLCKRPSHIGDQIKAMAAEQSRVQVEQVDAGYLNDQNSAMRKFSDKQSRVQFGGK
jgi:hypothetical protein